MPNTDIRRHSFQRDMLKSGVQMRLTVQKQSDGTYKAKADQHDIEGTGVTEQDAIVACKKNIQDQLTKGDFSNIHQQMV